jgi:nicotinamidase-related amidase
VWEPSVRVLAPSRTVGCQPPRPRRRHLVLCGIATSGVVLSTLRAAADLDFELTVLHDACVDGDPEVHRVLTEKVFPRQAAVLDVAAWSAGLR